MSMNEYQDLAWATAEFLDTDLYAKVYCGLGLAGEAGEVANKIKKILRDFECQEPQDFKDKIAEELGDTLWYLSALARIFGFTLQQIADLNIVKINRRAENGTIQGEGDDR